ncbi:MAG: glycosyltransferase family 39 protein [Deltaproteobacteria bacterium]|nr:glycosyltransferase family 39 protein [Deltaproteobacteria bacterium]
MNTKVTNTSLLIDLLVVGAILIIVVTLFMHFGFNGGMAKDNGIFAYSGQQMSEGIPPYISSFDQKAPMCSLLSGIGVIIARSFGWDDIRSIRVLFFILGCLTCVGLYFLGKQLFESRRAGFLASLILPSYVYYTEQALSGPRGKLPVVLFEVFWLWVASRKQWFMAGLFAGLCIMTWQPSVFIPLITLFLAFVSDRENRWKSLLQAAAGIALPAVVILSYFAYHGALWAVYDRAVIFPLYFGDRFDLSLYQHILRPVASLVIGYPMAFQSIIVGLVMCVYFYFWRINHNQSLIKTFTSDKFAPLLLAFPLFAMLILYDLQGPSDYFIMIPYSVIGFAGLLHFVLSYLQEKSKTTWAKIGTEVVFLGLAFAVAFTALWSIHLTRNNRLEGQISDAKAIEERYGKDAKIMSIGRPDVLAFLKRRNPNPYTYVLMGIDRHIAAKWPGGFEGWLRDIEEYDPDVIVKGNMDGPYIPRLMEWLETNYHYDKVGQYEVYAKHKVKENKGQDSVSVSAEGTDSK